MTYAVSVETVAELYATGMTATAIGKQVNMTKHAVLYRLARAGIPRRSRGPVCNHVERDREIVAAYRELVTLAPTAVRFGLSRQRIHQIIRQHERLTGERVINRSWHSRK